MKVKIGGLCFFILQITGIFSKDFLQMLHGQVVSVKTARG